MLTEGGAEQQNRPPSAVDQPQKSSKATLLLRIATAVVAAGITCSVLSVSVGWPLALLGAFLIWAGAWELGDLMRWQGWARFFATAAALSAVAGVAGTFYNNREHTYLLYTTTILFLVGIATAVWNVRSKIGIGINWLSILWLVSPILTLLAIHEWRGIPAVTPHPVLFMLIPIWAGDTAAYFFGRKFGRRPLAPLISPKKTIEGGIANIIAAVGTAAALAPYFKVDWLPAVLVGLSAGILGQCGDLFESWLKRHTGVKDSGGLLPGHGGILDRIDSVLFAAIPSCWVIVLLAPQMFHVKQ
jgi:phosphatidate cytidylyltransferase